MVVLDCPKETQHTHSPIHGAGSDNRLHRASTDGRMGVSKHEGFLSGMLGFSGVGCIGLSWQKLNFTES